MASTYLTAGTMGSVTNRKKFTISFWIKRGSLGEEYMWQSYNASSLTSYRLQIDFQSDDKFEIRGVDGNTMHTRLVTNREFKDTNAWYHIYCSFDSTQGTASDRVKIYVNGEQQTSLATSTYPNQNVDFAVGVDGSINYTLDIGRWGGGSNYWSGSMSHFYYVDGSVIAHTQFGSTDTTTGEWKINTNPTIASYGNEGFLVLKDGNTVTDQSPNSNNLTVGGGTLTKTEDNPSNVFDTLNANISQTAGVGGRDSSARPFLEYGNTVSSTDVAIWTPQIGSIPITSGKYYFEMKRAYAGSPSNHLAWVGIESTATAGTSLGSPSGTNTNAIAYYSEGSVNKSNVNQSGSWSTWTSNNDIVQVAIDLDNYFIYFGKNGVWQNSGNPESGGSGTGGIAIVASQSYISACTVHRGGGSSGGSKTWVQLNYGNGYFAENALSSAGTNASGNGIFEYDVPAGFTAISTKGLNL